MYLTQKIRIFPSQEQEKVLWDLSEKCRLIYNFGLKERLTIWNRNKAKPKEKQHKITYSDQQNKLPILKEKYPEYKWVYSKVLQMVLRKLDESYKSFFAKWNYGDKTARPPKFKGKKHFTTLCYNQSGFKVNKERVKFSHHHPSRVPLKFALRFPYYGNREIKQVDITYHSNNKWFVCITYEIEPPKYKDNGLYQAIDLGIDNLVFGVNLHFKFLQLKNRRPDLYWKKKIAEVQSKRDHCRHPTKEKPHLTKSKKWYWYDKNLISMKRKQSNQLRDYQHKISKQVVRNTKANTIIIGDLNVKEMAKKKKGTGNAKKTKINKTLNHSIHNTGSFGRFVQFLTYKAELLGKRIIRIDESFTSQDCCICRKRVKRKLSERMFFCDCGNTMERDQNSAVNIMERFLLNKIEYDFLSHQPSLNEESFLKRLDLLRNTALSSLCVGDRGLVVKLKKLKSINF